MNRLVRRIAALVAIAALAFSQLAVSAYACAQDRPQVHGETSMPCEEIGGANLCERHCDYGAAANGTQAAPAAVAIPVATASWRIAPAASLSPTRAWARPFERSIERPPLIRFSVLRI